MQWVGKLLTNYVREVMKKDGDKGGKVQKLRRQSTKESKRGYFYSRMEPPNNNAISSWAGWFMCC